MSLKVALLVACALLPGCNLLGSRGPTDVARGEYYAAGKPSFDSFFIQLHDLQVELLAAPGEPQKARAHLTQALGLQAEASNDSLRIRLSQELSKLENQGLRVRLEVPESPALDASATLYTSESHAPSSLRAALPQEATTLVRSRNRMQATRTRLEKLRVLGIELEGTVDAQFRVDGPWKRDEVRRNLADGQKLITLMHARSQAVEEQSSQLLTLIAAAANTDASLGKAVAAAPPPAEPLVSKAGPRRNTAKPAAVAKPAGATGKPSASDGAAAPKPVQGSAPAEIEP